MINIDKIALVEAAKRLFLKRQEIAQESAELGDAVKIVIAEAFELYEYLMDTVDGKSRSIAPPCSALLSEYTQVMGEGHA